MPVVALFSERGNKMAFAFAARGRAFALMAALSAAGCTSAPDPSAILAERAKPIQRYDIIQSMASAASTIVAGTQGGAVLVSNDSGTSWQRHVLGQASVIGLAACPDGSFFGIDFYQSVWSSDPAGNKWNKSKFAKPTTALTLTCDQKGRWWIAGTRATIAMSADKGASWQVTDLNKDAQLTSIQFVDANYGVATGEFGMVAVTSDGGANWEQRDKMPDDFYPYSTLFVSRMEGWASGIAGQILHTTDGAKTWIRQANATPRLALYQLFLHQGAPHGVGAGGVVARLTGDTWQPVPYSNPVPVPLSAGASLAGGTRLAIGGPAGLVRVIDTNNPIFKR
jgi:photosystem II stability/assembly factor-like uncharacterized protein